MFKQLRQHSQIYILHKGDNYNVEVGFVNSVSAPYPKFTTPPVFGTQQELLVDITVLLNGQTVNFTRLGADTDIAESYSNNEYITITTSKEALNAELNNIKQKSIDIINSVEANKKTINECEKVLKALNPEYAERENQANEIKEINQRVDGINQRGDKIYQMLEKQNNMLNNINKNNNASLGNN